MIISGNKNKLVVRIFSSIENNVISLKIAFEIKERFKEKLRKEADSR